MESAGGHQPSFYFPKPENETASIEWEHDFNYICFLVSKKLHPCAGQILRYVVEDEYTCAEIAKIFNYSRMNIVFIMNKIKQYLKKNRNKVF
jgi:hypothetical protein